MKNKEKIEELEKTLNNVILKIVIGFSFLLDYNYKIALFLKLHYCQIIKHLLIQYKKTKKYYKSFVAWHKEYTKDGFKF